MRAAQEYSNNERILAVGLQVTADCLPVQMGVVRRLASCPKLLLKCVLAVEARHGTTQLPNHAGTSAHYARR